MTPAWAVFGLLCFAGCAYAFWRWGRDRARHEQAVERGKVLVDVTGTIEAETDPEKIAADWDEWHGGAR